jgi:pyrimidine-nucleoside phosphorylase
MDVVGAIAAKRDGRELDAATLRALVRGFTDGEVPDYQMSAFLMAGYLRGFSAGEASALTQAMVESGERLDLSALRGPVVDKHSTGGVADGTTLIVAPLAAELGMQLLKLSGRGLGHTGGTLDKLESIPGMRTALPVRELLAQVDRIGLAVGAQTAELAPADGALYALRDVTATVANTALIASSVMSKKLAGGASAIVIDVKVGSGAFMKELATARELAALCVALGRGAGRATAAVLSDMSQPLGTMIGNAVEVREAIEVLRGERRTRLRELSVALAAELARLAGVADDAEDGRARAEQALDSGATLERFRLFVEAQGGDPRVIDRPGLLPAAPLTREVTAPRHAWLAAVDGEAVGMAAARLGAGRQRKGDAVDPATGIEFLPSVGDEVAEGAPVARVFARDDAHALQAEKEILGALAWAGEPVSPPPLIHGRVGGGLGTSREHPGDSRTW